LCPAEREEGDVPAQDMPAAEVAIDTEVVRALLVEQHTDLADLELAPLGFGWDNALFRLGPELVVRLPRRLLAVPLIEHEQRWLPELALHLPLPVPVPLRVGRPGARFPWPWSICPWLPGTSALVAPPDDPVAAAAALGAFVAALHRPAPPDAPENPFRGIPLRDRDERTITSIDQMGTAVDGPLLRSLWQELSAAPVWPGPDLWLHGDLHPGNLVVDQGRLSAVVDFGDLTSGDPACDLAVAWMLLPAEARPVFRAAAGAGPSGEVDDDTWTRARGWALALGAVTMANSGDNPAYAAHGAHTTAAAVAG
jgi:aminoglycoside phosphotransferase (APT) family kinase protein